MKLIHIPHEVLAAEIRAGHVTLSGEGVKTISGTLGAIATRRAATGLESAAASAQDGRPLEFPPGCCKCLRDGLQVRSIDTTSLVSRGIEYSFRFRVPHCPDCAPSANRKRPGLMGKLAAFLAVGFAVFLALLVYGFAKNDFGIALASLVAGPLAGLAIPFAWGRLRAPRAGQPSRYQAVYVDAIDIDGSGEPLSFTLAFENADYADRFVALNADQRILDA